MAKIRTWTKIAEIFDTYMAEHSQEMTPAELAALREIRIEVHAAAVIEKIERGQCRGTIQAYVNA